MESTVQRMSRANKVQNHVNGDMIPTSIHEYPVTVERRPYRPSSDDGLIDPGTARANIAPSSEAPYGTTQDNYSERMTNKTVLQQHCAFFDADGDGIIWPLDTYRGFHAIGFNVILSLLAVFIIHANFSYPSVPGFLPDPFFRLYLKNIHKTKHGSDSGTYDNEGRFIPQKFEDFFTKYGGDKDGLSAYDLWNAIKGQRVIMDPIGWGGAIFEWLATYLFLWPEDGIIKKEDVRKVYDGSIFYEMAEKRGNKRKKLE